MVNYAQAANALIGALHLDTPPIALAFVDNAPVDVTPTTEAVPSACSFWRSAETATFYAAAEAHLGCPVGAMVMGFALPEASQQELMSLAEFMVGCGYLGSEEVARIPSMAGAPAGIVYGPLSDFPYQPSVVLMWLSPRDAMRYAEAAGNCAWNSTRESGLLGRPACAALPQAVQSGSPALSLGCAGMRTFTEISTDRLLAAVPGKELETFLTSLQHTLEANEVMQRFYDSRKTPAVPV
jgi:uncharacterized protein (DUF169 family)